MMSTYLTPEEYSGDIPHDELDRRLSEASRAIDGLTFNRIVERGFDKLTSFQQGLIKESVRTQADFAYANAELLDSPLSAYSISGVSMTFDRSKVQQIGTVTTTNKVMELLMQTGLCYRGIM